MKNKKYIHKPTEKKKIEYHEFDSDIDTTASITDYTGLMPSAPTSEAELESYQELYPTARPVKKLDNKK